MKKISAKCVSLCLALLLAVGGTVYAAGSASDTAPEGEETSMPEASSARAAMEKDETVYVLANADGSAQEIIVSDWLKNPGSGSVADKSGLREIENVKGDETFTQNGETLTWNAAGEDIYYQGTSDKPLPVEVKVSFTLDGKEISPQELAGKSGRVTIRFDYTNTAGTTVEIDGRQETVFVPFAVLTGVMMDNEVFSNVSVTGGKLLNDGDRTAVVGIALPGLQESLGIPEDTLKLPDFLEITADARNFALGMTLTVATNEPFSALDVDSFGDMDSLSGDLDRLTDGMAALLDGSSQLYEGLETLLAKSGELSTGVDALAAGSRTLSDGAASLDNGAAKLQAGVESLSTGLETLNANSDSLNAASRQVFETLLASANTQLAAAGVDVPALTPENYAQVLDGLVSSVTATANAQAEAAVRNAVEARRGEIAEQVTGAVRAQVTAQVEAAMPGADNAAVTAAVERQMASDEIRAAIEQNVETQIDKLVEENMASPEVQTQLDAAAQGLQAVTALKASLDSYNAFYTGLQTYTAGVGQAAAGAGELKSGAAELKSGAAQLTAGAKELSGGAAKLKDSLPALTDGITALRDGAKELRDGLNEFNDEGISKLTELFSGDTDALLARLGALRDAAQGFRSYSGITEGTAGQVKFIYRTEPIEY